MKKLIAGNWKMNTTKAEALALASALKTKLPKAAANFDLVISPPAIWLTSVADAVKDSGVQVGAQDGHTQEKGAYTGNIAAPMIKEAGAAYVIVGHSERRQHHQEDNATVKAKAEASIKNGLIPIVCVGEVEAEREAGKQNDVVGKQLAESLPNTGHYVVAYEPVWAIGTGKTASAQDVKDMHAFIRAELAKKLDRPETVAILYGGSVKASNAKEILSTPNVDGVLVGGASLQADEFWAIAQAA